MKKTFKIFMTGTLVALLAISLVACDTDKEPTNQPDNNDAHQVVTPDTNQGNENNSNISVGKLEATALETYFRSYRVAFEVVARENAGFNTFGWDIGDNAGGLANGDTIVINEKTYTYTNASNDAGDHIRNAYDEGDMNLNGIMDDTEEWTGRKVYTENWTGNYTLNNPANPDDKSAYNALEHAINANLDPKFQIELSYDGTFTTLVADPWGTNFHGMFITNTLEDKTDRGAFIILSDGPDKTENAKVNIANGVISLTGNTDDFYLSTIYTYKNGYGEVVSDMKLPIVKEDSNNTENNNSENNNSNNNNQNQDNNQNTNNTIEIVDVDWNQLVTVDFGKLNGYATPTLTVNYDYFETKILAQNVKIFLSKETSYGITRLIESECNNWFTVEFVENYQNLSNGDKIQVKIILNNIFYNNGMSFETFCQKLGFNFDEKAEFIVSDLSTDFVAVNFLEALIPCVQYSGANGFVNVSNYPFISQTFEYNVGEIYIVRGEYSNSIKILHNNTKIVELSVFTNAEGVENLNDEDQIDLYFYYDQEVDDAFKKLSELGYIIPYKIESNGHNRYCKIMVDIPYRGEYLTSQAQLTENNIVALKNMLNTYTNNEYVYEAIYLVKYKPGVECQHDVIYCVVGVYFESGWIFSGYTYDIFYDVIIQPDNTIVCEHSIHDNAYNYGSSIEEINSMIDDEGYEIIKIVHSKSNE
jgi:hypothetical protein